jgi:hypothetical protein
MSSKKRKSLSAAADGQEKKKRVTNRRFNGWPDAKHRVKPKPIPCKPGMSHRRRILRDEQGEYGPCANCGDVRRYEPDMGGVGSEWRFSSGWLRG